MSEISVGTPRGALPVEISAGKIKKRSKKWPKFFSKMCLEPISLWKPDKAFPETEKYLKYNFRKFFWSAEISAAPCQIGNFGHFGFF